MSITLELPDDIEQCLASEWPELPRKVLEAVALEGYRQQILSRGQVSRLLRLEFWKTETFLKEHAAYLPDDIHDVEDDLQTNRRVLRR